MLMADYAWRWPAYMIIGQRNLLISLETRRTLIRAPNDDSLFRDDGAANNFANMMSSHHSRSLPSSKVQKYKAIIMPKSALDRRDGGGNFYLEMSDVADSLISAINYY